jgi:ribose-phosphate pyrophosphokinase
VRWAIEKWFRPGGDTSNMIVSGSSTQALAAELAAVTDESLAPVEFERFPDGEGMARVGEIGDHAIVVASTVSDEAHVECLQLQDAAREAGASEVTTVLPYMGYARQDRAFEEGEPVSARAVARAVSTGTDRVLTVNPHEDAVCEYFTVPAESVDAAGRLADPLPDDLTDPLFLSPDEGAIDLAATVADAYGRGDTDFFEKTRHSGTEVEITPSDAAVGDRDVVLVDDIIATGSTMSESVTVLNDRDARAVYVTCIHPLLASNAVTKLSRAGVEAIYGTDTIERSVSEVSVAPAIADAL